MAKRKLPARKSSKVIARTLPAAKSGTQVLGRVNPDFTGFIWNFTDKEVRSAADSIAKHIEMAYQLELLKQSGFVLSED